MFTSLTAFFSATYHYILLKYKKVDYETLPTFKGKILIYNSGSIVIGRNVTFNSNIKSNWVGLNKPCTICVRSGAKLIIGNESGFSGVSIFASREIIIGDFANFGGNVSIWDTDFHPLEFEARRRHDESQIISKPILIGNDVFVGANSIILKGVSIGEKSIVGAGSVVSRDIPAGQIWAGNPIKFIRNII
jgi:acetyltransferase-like isoleucine patch superfamily enzyme